METANYTTSELALIKMEGKQKKHHEIILRTLELCPYALTAFGIAKRCEIDYVAVNRRLCELRDPPGNLPAKVYIDRRIIDTDGAWRNAYLLCQ